MLASEYVTQVQRAVERALRLGDYPSPLVRGDSKPIIEVEGPGHPLIAEPLLIQRGPEEKCLVEWSVNAARISFKFKTADELERHILDSHARFFMQRRVRAAFLLDATVPFGLALCESLWLVMAGVATLRQR